MSTSPRFPGPRAAKPRRVIRDPASDSWRERHAQIPGPPLSRGKRRMGGASRQGEVAPSVQLVIPANAGIQIRSRGLLFIRSFRGPAKPVTRNPADASTHALGGKQMHHVSRMWPRLKRRLDSRLPASAGPGNERRGRHFYTPAEGVAPPFGTPSPLTGRVARAKRRAGWGARVQLKSVDPRWSLPSGRPFGRTRGRGKRKGPWPHAGRARSASLPLTRRASPCRCPRRWFRAVARRSPRSRFRRQVRWSPCQPRRARCPTGGSCSPASG